MGDMRKRLIELILNAPRKGVVYGDIKLDKPVQTAQSIADHLLANGVVALPCNVGDTVYGFHLKNVLPYSVKWQETDDRGEWRVVAQYPPMAPRFYKLEDFGKTVFLTKEQAEQALKERVDDG